MSSIFRIHTLFVVLLLWCGCSRGPKMNQFAPAHGMEGIQTTIHLIDISTENRSLQGELLAVEEADLLILLNSRITRIPFTNIQKATFNQLPGLIIGAGRMPGSSKRNQLRLLSRYPQGLEGAVLARFLRSEQQNAIDEIK